VPIIPVKTPQRERRTDDILGQVARQALIPRGAIPFWHIGHNPLTIARVTRSHSPLDRLALHRPAQHGQQRPLPLFPQQGIGQRVEMAPLLGRGILSTTGRNDMQMRVVLAIAPMRLDDHDGTALQAVTTAPAEPIIQTLDATAHEGTQQRTGVLITRRS